MKRSGDGGGQNICITLQTCRQIVGGLDKASSESHLIWVDHIIRLLGQVVVGTGEVRGGVEENASDIDWQGGRGGGDDEIFNPQILGRLLISHACHPVYPTVCNRSI